MVKKIVFVIAINILVFIFAELSVKFTLKILNLPTVYKVSGIDQNRFDFLTGYFNQPNQKEKIINNSYKQGTDKYGFNIDGERNNNNLDIKTSNEFRIFILGASSVQGRNLADKYDPISARLEKKLNNLKIKKKIVVINTGTTSFTTSQEVNLAKDRIMYALKPDMLIFLNGSNDATDPPGNELFLSNSHVYQRTFQQNIHYASKNFFYFLDDFFSKNISIYFLFKKIIEKTSNKVFFDRENRNNHDLKDLLDLEIKINRYIYNIEVLSKLASKDIPILVFFQPQMLPSNYNTLIKEDKNFYDQQKNKNPEYFKRKQFFYTKISENIRNKNNFKTNDNFKIYDLSDKLNFNNSDIQYYSDHSHYTSFSRQIIADLIYQEIIKIMDFQ